MPRGAHDSWGPQLWLCFSEKMGVTLHPLKIKRPKKNPKSRSQTRNCHLPSRPTRAPGPGGQSLEVKMTAGNRYCQETRRRPVGWPGHPLHPILPVTATHPIPRKLGAHSSSQAQTIQSSLPEGRGNLPVLWLRCPPSLTIVQLTPGVGVPRSPTPSSKHSGNFYCRKEADRGAARN